MRIAAIISAIVLLGCSTNPSDGFATPPPKPSPTLTPGPVPITPPPSPKPTATAIPTATPPIVNGIQQYGTATDGTKLHWKIYQPTGTGPWPFVILIHGGGFRTGGYNDGSQAGIDLQRAGYFVAAIEYRLDTDKLAGQTTTGTWHQQTDDVKMAVRSARNDKRCDGNVFAVGGSAGGTHASSVAIEATDRVDASVCLSGAYKFDDRTAAPQYLDSQTRDFNDYTATTDLAKQLADSPISFVDKTAMPMYLVRSQNDPMPVAHQNAMISKLQSVGVINFQFITVSGQGHSFANWPAVSTKAIAFLNSHKKKVSSFTPTPSPSATLSPSATPTSTPTSTPTPSSTPVVVREYAKGVWASTGAGNTIPPALVANKGVVGVTISADWNVVEKVPGIYDWTVPDAKLANAKAAGFHNIILAVADGSDKTPQWFLDSLPADQKIALLDPAANHNTFCTYINTPLYWGATYHQKRLDLIAAAGAHYANDPDIVATFCNFASHNSNDWNTLDEQETVHCGTRGIGGDQVIDQPAQWLAAGWTRAKVLQVGKDICDAVAVAWPSQNLKLPIGGLAAPLADAPVGSGGVYSTLAQEIVAYVKTRPYANRFYISRNTAAATWNTADALLPPNPPPGMDAENYIKYMVAVAAPKSGLQTVSFASECMTGQTCRQNGSLTVVSPEDVMQRSLNAMVSYHNTFAEIWTQDAQNPAFYDMIKAATVAMGGTPRP